MVIEMNKKKISLLIVIILVIIGVVIAFNVIGNNKQKQQDVKIKKDDARDKTALKIINNACDNLIDEEGNYNVGGPETEVVCEKGFCHINYQGENYALDCKEEQ